MSVMNNATTKITTKIAVLALLALMFMLFLHGSVPFLATPANGLAVWTTGFSQSFLNDSIFTIYARNFGAPEPAAIAFGLAGAWTTTLFMKLGLYPADAYSAMTAFWLSISFFSAYRISRLFGALPLLSILGAVLWLSMPVIWAHAGYSMLSIGIGLLSFYFLSTLNLFLTKIDSRSEKIRIALLFIFACIISVFMDGYSFMMFAVASTIFAVCAFVNFPEQRYKLFYYAIPIHTFGFGLAYLLYILYVGKPQFDPERLSFFRAWGVDLTFIVIPTKGMHWIPDILGWSTERLEENFFGDASVWVTTFSIPLVIAACWAWWKAKDRRKLATGLMLVAVFGFYMALGPSLKVNSVKPEGEKTESLMPDRYAVAPTGSALLSENLPGFKNMRASYRWLALGVLGCWLLLVLAMSSTNRRTAFSAMFVVILVITFNLPNPQKWDLDINNRELFLHIDADLLAGMREFIHRGEKVAFLPYRNDFLVNYLASQLNIVSYNTGGDKNLTEALKHWPDTMRQFSAASIDQCFTDRIVLLLARNEADVVILPYIDMQSAAFRWPYPVEFKEVLSPVLSQLINSGFVSVVEHNYYAVVRLNKNVRLNENSSEVKIYPIKVEDCTFSLLRTIGIGWYGLERTHVWSGPEAELKLPVPSNCASRQCSAVLTLSAYGASSTRPIEVLFHTGSPDLPVSAPAVFRDSARQQVTIPLTNAGTSQLLVIRVPKAASPIDLEGSADERVLGVALHSIELVRQEGGINEQAPEDGGAGQHQAVINKLGSNE